MRPSVLSSMRMLCTAALFLSHTDAKLDGSSATDAGPEVGMQMHRIACLLMHCIACSHCCKYRLESRVLAGDRTLS